MPLRLIIIRQLGMDMNKKITIIALLAIFLIFTISSPLTGAKTTSERDQELVGFFESKINIEKDKEINEPLNPLDSKEIKITVGFKLNIGSLTKQLLFNRRIGRLILFGPSFILKLLSKLPKANVTLSVEGCPDWCTATLDKSNLEFDYNNELIEQETTLTISVNESPPALEQAVIVVKAKYAGHWTIKAASNSTNISLLSAYKSKIEWGTETEYTIPPLKNTTIPVNITNNGNGETIVGIGIVDPPENWNISIDQEEITIPVGKMQQINLVVIPPKGFDEETIQLKLTPKSTSDADLDDEYLEGGPISLSITLLNDGSLEEEEGIGIETILLIAFAIIIIVIVALILLLRRKKQ